jgi:phosphatidate cytidylyltransferase
MLKQRILTAAILIPIFVLLVLLLPPRGFGYLTWAFVLLGAWEWSGLMGLKTKIHRLCYPIFLSAFLPLSIFFPLVLFTAVIAWCFAFILVVLYPRGSRAWGTGIFWRGVMGLFIFIPTFCALNFLRDTNIFGVNHGRYIILFLFVLIWGADSGAYFAGKKWGKTKLAPAVSPGKTWQGLAGALTTTIILAPSLYFLFPTPRPLLGVLMSLAVITVLFSVLGDLFESMLKRNVGVKDSGNLMPGHGGLLDRIDSLTAAAPVFAFGCLLVLKFFH